MTSFLWQESVSLSSSSFSPPRSFAAVAIGNCATGRCCSQMVLTDIFPTRKSKNNTELVASNFLHYAQRVGLNINEEEVKNSSLARLRPQTFHDKLNRYCYAAGFHLKAWSTLRENKVSGQFSPTGSTNKDGTEPLCDAKVFLSHSFVLSLFRFSFWFHARVNRDICPITFSLFFLSLIGANQT